MLREIVIIVQFFKKKKLCYDLELICDLLLFYAHVHTFSPSYTEEK